MQQTDVERQLIHKCTQKLHCWRWKTRVHARYISIWLLRKLNSTWRERNYTRLLVSDIKGTAYSLRRHFTNNRYCIFLLILPARYHRTPQQTASIAYYKIQTLTTRGMLPWCHYLTPKSAFFFLLSVRSFPPTGKNAFCETLEGFECRQWKSLKCRLQIFSVRWMERSLPRA